MILNDKIIIIMDLAKRRLSVFLKNMKIHVKSEVFPAVTMKMPSSGMLRRVALVRINIVFLRSLRWLLVTASVVPSSHILVTLMMEALRSSETSVRTA
jgi:hypothetical protein